MNHLELLRSLHDWFLSQAPQHYKGCGLCIDVEAALEARERPEPSQHVAWLRYKPGNDGRPTTIHLCDSDAPGAFKVYRSPPEVASLRARLQWTRDRWDDIVDDAACLMREGLLLGIKTVAENERAACDALLNPPHPKDSSV